MFEHRVVSLTMFLIIKGLTQWWLI